MSLDSLKDSLPIANACGSHVPAVLLIDISRSMEKNAIDDLNKGLVEFGKYLKSDSLASKRAEICIISFNSVICTEMGFRPAITYEAPVLHASGLSMMNEAIEVAINALDTRILEYRTRKISYFRPWLFLLTDGVPTDTKRESSAKERLKEYVEKNKVVFMPIGIGPNADVEKLRSYYPDNAQSRPVIQATTPNYQEVFSLLVKCLSGCYPF